jgi:hypothetical protein
MWLLALLLIAIIGIGLARPARSRRRLATAMSVRAGQAGERRVSRVLRTIPGLDHIDDFVFTHHGLTVQIDHLVRGKDRIWVLETKHWTGIVDGTRRNPIWTVRRRGYRRRDRRQNPIEQNAWHCEALSAAFDVPTASLVVFSGSAKFAVSRPQGIIFLADLAAFLARVDGARPLPGIAHTWSRLVACAANASQHRLRAAHAARVAAATHPMF